MIIINIVNLIKENCCIDNIAVKYSKKEISYRKMFSEAEKLSQIINDYLGCGYESVGIFFNGSVNFVISLLAVIGADKTAVPLNVHMTQAEADRIIDYLNIRLILTDEVHLNKAEEVFRGKTDFICIDNDNISVIKSILYYIDKNYTDIELNDVAVILHTSGSVNTPKSVMLTHENIFVCADAIIKDFNINSLDNSLVILPVYYASSLVAQIFTHLLSSGTIVFSDILLTPKGIFRNIEKYGITNFSAVPGIIADLSSSVHLSGNYDLSALRYVCCGGGAASGKKIDVLIQAFPKVSFIRTYGLTELSTRVSHYTEKLGKINDTCVGKAISCTKIKISYDDEKNNFGEIVVSGKNVMKGYYRRDDETSNVLKNNWFYTGDIGRIDENGNLHIVGRKKNIIIRNGENIYPEEIEEILCGFPDVKEAYVYGISDERLGQVPVADIVLNNSDEFLLNLLINYCYEKMSRFKVPVEFNIRNSIEKTSNGKIKRVRK